MLAQVVLFDGFDPLDVVAPFEVFEAAGIATDGAMGVELVAAGGPREVVSGSSGLSLRAVAAPDLTRADIVVVPGASGPLEPHDDRPGMSIPERLAAAAETALADIMRTALADPSVLVGTVCGGSLILAMAGLLDGRPTVTHHLGMAVLAHTGAEAIDARVVDDGDFVSAGGVTSGLDLGLHLVHRCLGSRVALEVERLFEYERRGTPWTSHGMDVVAGSHGSAA